MMRAEITWAGLEVPTSVSRPTSLPPCTSAKRRCALTSGNLAKIDAGGRAQAVVFAYESGLIRAGEQTP